jgi:hypothetical protein
MFLWLFIEQHGSGSLGVREPNNMHDAGSYYPESGVARRNIYA